MNVLTHRPLLPPGNAPGTHFCQGLSRSQGHSRLEGFYVNEKLTPAGIEPATFRFVEQHLNHCATAVLTFMLILPDNRKTIALS